MLTPTQGKSPYIGLMRPRGIAWHHPAAALLHSYATEGCPVDCGRPWSKEELIQAVHKGPHPSAKTKRATLACRREALERIKDNCCRLVKWKDLLRNLPPNLKISPIAAIPHKSREYRMILDLSYKLITKHLAVPSVNDASEKTIAPQHAMYELGNVIPRLVHQIAHMPNPEVPILFAKVDLKDGYWRMVVSAINAYHFAYVLPTIQPSDNPDIVIPDSLQMGWSESPPFFCAATETARDIAQQTFDSKKPQQPHPMEDIMLSHIQNLPTRNIHPHSLIEVYIDDFLAMVQAISLAYITRLTRALLHAIESVFPGPDITNSSMGPAISTKKLLEEGAWTDTKEILGWQFNGTTRTIQLPPKKADKLITTLQNLQQTRWITLNEIQKLHGRLQFTSIAVPCSKAFLGPIDRLIAKATAKEKTHIYIDKATKQLFNNWIEIIHSLMSRPTHVKELIEHKPAFRGFVDAAKWGVGGVWFGGTKPMEPTVWFFPWPETIQNAIITDDNPKGTITISDLELAGVLLHFMVLEQLTLSQPGALRHQTPAIWCDNLSAVAWIYKFRASTSPCASRLLRALAGRLRTHQTALINAQHINGRYNILADVASRKHTTHPAAFLAFYTN